MKRPSLKQLIAVFLAGITLMALTLAWSYWTVLASVQQQYVASYKTLAPNKIYSGNMDDEVVGFIVGKIGNELSAINIQGPLPIFAQCQVTGIEVLTETQRVNRWWQRVRFRLVLDDPYHHLSYVGRLSCDVNWPLLGASQWGIAILLLIILRAIPAPLAQATTQIIEHFEQFGFTQSQGLKLAQMSEPERTVIERIVQHPALSSVNRDKLLALVDENKLKELSARNLAWLSVQYHHTNSEEQAFLNTFHLPEVLQFCAEERLLTIKGLEIKLTPTPFYYYLWYAEKRLVTDEGWVLNPLTTKADHELAGQLILLMEQNGGHGKAINDLSRNGLTAKKLDQNRNKIKDEIVAVLGEELAQPFLFEGQREPTSSRYLYRIQASKEKLKIL